jgi:aryl-alcohol dehydrogenase-like predicted oxidoreductase
METRPFADFHLSRLMIGTVQFGMAYGIANKTGQPSYRDVRDMLALAHESGVNCLDTAALYGTSEEVVGRALAELGIAGKMIIVTKTTHLADDLTEEEADSVMEQSVLRSLKRLRLEALPLCLIHHEENFRYVQSLLKLKEKGLVRHVGSSVMTPAITKGIVNSGLVEAVQAPTSVLDRRYVSAGIFRDAVQRGLGLFVRSIYLQGLILLGDDEVQPELAAVVPVLQRLRALAGQAGMSLAELAVRYVLSLEGVTSGVVGVETIEQLRNNIAIFQKGPLDAALMKAIIAAVPQLPDSILMPNKWPKRIPDAKPVARPE